MPLCLDSPCTLAGGWPQLYPDRCMCSWNRSSAEGPQLCLPGAGLELQGVPLLVSQDGRHCKGCTSLCLSITSLYLQGWLEPLPGPLEGLSMELSTPACSRSLLLLLEGNKSELTTANAKAMKHLMLL